MVIFNNTRKQPLRAAAFGGAVDSRSAPAFC